MKVRLNRNKYNLLGLLFPIVFFGLGLYIIIFKHVLFEEWDGVANLFAGREIFQGKGFVGWSSHYYGPLYAVLLGFLNLFLEGFFAGKLLSLVSATILLIYIYNFSYFLTKSVTLSIFIQIFIASNSIFFISSIQVENNMLDSVLIVISFYYLIKAINLPCRKYLILTGIFVSLAFLTRQTSIIFAPIFFLFFIIYFDNKKTQKKKLILSFLLSFLIISSPWLILNTIKNGSPIASWQYLNLGKAISEEGAKWLWSIQSEFNNIFDVIIYYYPNIIPNFLNNLYDVFYNTLFIMPILGVVLCFFYIPTFFHGLIKYQKRFLIYFSAFVIYVSGISFFLVYEQLLLCWIIIFSMESIIFLKDFVNKLVMQYRNLKIHISILEKIKEKLLRREKISSFIIFTAIIVPLIGVSIYSTNIEFNDYINDYGELYDAKEIGKFLKEYDDKIHEKYVMAHHPGYAYYANSFYLNMPGYYEGSIEDYVNYIGISEKVLNYFPKYPASEGILNFSADYLIFTNNSLPQFQFLFDINSSLIPSNFKLLFISNFTVVYEIIK